MSGKVIKVWYQLTNIMGHPYKNSVYDRVTLLYPCDVVDFKKAVKTEYYNILPECSTSADLKVYESKEAFDKKEELDEALEMELSRYGNSKDNPLYVLVPFPGVAQKPISKFIKNDIRKNT